MNPTAATVHRTVGRGGALAPVLADAKTSEMRDKLAGTHLLLTDVRA